MTNKYRRLNDIKSSISSGRGLSLTEAEWLVAQLEQSWDLRHIQTETHADNETRFVSERKGFEVRERVLMDSIKEIQSYARQCYKDKKPIMAWRVAEKTTSALEIMRKMESIQVQTLSLIKEHWKNGMKNAPSVILVSSHEDERTGIRYNPTDNTLEIIRDSLALFGDADSFPYLLHQLCHWYLYVTDQPWMSKDVEFALELIRVGAGDTCDDTKDAKLAYETALKTIVSRDERT